MADKPKRQGGPECGERVIGERVGIEKKITYYVILRERSPRPKDLEYRGRGDFMSKEYYVYIMTNKSRTLYTGVTNNLMRRVDEHKKKLVQGFTSKYNIQFLAYYESTPSIHEALVREKQIKGWLRVKKIALINSMNPGWKDLSEEWFV